MSYFYQQLERSARRQQQKRFEESEQYWLARRQRRGLRLPNLLLGLRTLFIKLWP